MNGEILLISRFSREAIEPDVQRIRNWMNKIIDFKISMSKQTQMKLKQIWNIEEERHVATSSGAGTTGQKIPIKSTSTSTTSEEAADSIKASRPSSGESGPKEKA